jgi:RecA/RadA recombinase|nr:MAG TPA: Helicase REPLICATION [Caudoviricetes sp.]
MATKKSPAELSTEECLSRLSKKYSGYTPDEFVKTGLLSVDIVLGGKGIPMGKLIDVSSESGLGKSTLLLHIAKSLCDQGHKCVWIDSECALSDSILNGIDNANNAPVGPLMKYKDEGMFEIFTVSSYAAVEEILDMLMPQGDFKFYFIDSLTNITSEAFLKSTVYDKDAKSVDSVTVAEDARVQSKFMKKVKVFAKQYMATIFFVSQQRTYINMGYGGKPSGAVRAGGKAIKYNMDGMIDIINLGEIKEKKTTLNGEEEIKVGRNIALYIQEKCRFGPGNVKVPAVIYYGKGYSNASTLRRFMETKQVADGNKLAPMLSNSGRSYTIRLGDEKIKLDGGNAVKEYIKENFDKILSFFDASDFALVQEDFNEALQNSTADSLGDDFDVVIDDGPVNDDEFDSGDDFEVTID